MKVFMVHEDPWHDGNPYIYTLMYGLQQNFSDCLLSWGRRMFWSDDIFSFDIVHFHWTQTFMGYDNHTEDELLHHIKKMKSAGVKVIATCHDLQPHYGRFSDKAESLNIVYSHCDAIIHLGVYSKSLFEKQYPYIKHFLLPHHLYDTVYHYFPSKSESIKYLGLPENYTYILCFGTFRAEEERQLVINLSKQLNDKKIIILAPGFMDVGWHSIFIPFRKLKKVYYQYRYNIYCSGRTWMSVGDDSLPYYYGVADLVFIQRLKILNSGNAVMPMLFGKVVVGPDCGNVGPLLRSWGYPVFNVDNITDVGNFVKEGLKLEKMNRGKQNRDKLSSNYSTANISIKLYEMYEELLLHNN